LCYLGCSSNQPGYLEQESPYDVPPFLIGEPNKRAEGQHAQEATSNSRSSKSNADAAECIYTGINRARLLKKNWHAIRLQMN
jgi:hypothetical protein